MTPDPSERWVVVLLAFLLSLLLIFVSVRDSPASITNSSPATNLHADSLLREATVVATIRWRHRGMRPCFPQIFVYDEDEAPVGARGDQGGCGIWFSRSFRDRVWEIYNDRQAPFWDRVNALSDLCAVAIHERGHNLGLDHYSGTVMNDAISGAKRTRECNYWVKFKMIQTMIGRRIYEATQAIHRHP